MEEEFRFGLMGQDMMDFGGMVWRMVMVDWSMLKVMYMKESGLKIKLMALVYILISMEAGMKDNGIKINSMDMVSNNGQMEQNTKDSMSKV